MKRNILASIGLLSMIGLMGATGELSAQNRRIKSMDDLFNTYEQVKGIEYVCISPSLLKLAKSKDSKEIDDVFNSIASLRILNVTITPELESLVGRIRQDVQNLVRQENFEELVKVRSDGSDFIIYLSQNKSKDSKQMEALLVVVNEKSELVLIGITGKITQKVIDAVLEGKMGILS